MIGNQQKSKSALGDIEVSCGNCAPAALDWVEGVGCFDGWKSLQSNNKSLNLSLSIWQLTTGNGRRHWLSARSLISSIDPRPLRSRARRTTKRITLSTRCAKQPTGTIPWNLTRIKDCFMQANQLPFRTSLLWFVFVLHEFHLWFPCSLRQLRAWNQLRSQ